MTACQVDGCSVRKANYSSGGVKVCARHVYSLGSLFVAAARCGATVDTSTERAQFVNVDAPTGKVWAASFTHALCVNWGTPGDKYGDGGDARERRLAICDALDRMAYGLDECGDADCDVCHPEPDQ